MAGAPSFGKMSTFIWRIATIDASATDMTATRIVIGRRMAVSTNHIDCAPASGYLVIWLSGHLVIWSFGYLVIRLFGYLLQKRREIAARLGGGEPCSPHHEPRHGIVGFGLREQPLRFGHFGDAHEPILIARARLALASRRSLALNGCVPRNLRRGLHERASFG